MTSLSVNRWGFTDKLLEINNLSGRRRVFTDKITFCETTINRNSSLGQSPNEKHRVRGINKSSSDDRPGPGICGSKYVEDAKAARSVRVWDRVPMKDRG